MGPVNICDNCQLEVRGRWVDMLWLCEHCETEVDDCINKVEAVPSERAMHLAAMVCNHHSVEYAQLDEVDQSHIARAIDKRL